MMIMWWQYSDVAAVTNDDYDGGDDGDNAGIWMLL